MYLVLYRTRGMSTGWIRQTVVVPASCAEIACDHVGMMLSRQYQAGSWFVDWSVMSAELVG